MGKYGKGENGPDDLPVWSHSKNIQRNGEKEVHGKRDGAELMGGGSVKGRIPKEEESLFGGMSGLASKRVTNFLRLTARGWKKDSSVERDGV